MPASLLLPQGLNLSRLTAEQKREALALLERKAELARARDAAEERRRVQENAELIRQRCQTLHGFIEEFWSVLEPTTPFVSGWAIRAMCEHLEAVHRGDIQNLLINVPPGMMKSLLVSVFFQGWEWGPMGRPDLRYLATSYSEANVVRDSNKVRKLVESPKYQALFGDKVQRSAKWGEKKFENTAGGNRDCRPFGSLTGGRGDRVLIDDPHSTESAESDAERARTVRTFREGASDRLNDVSRSATIVIMQRLHSQDVAGTILDLGLPYVHLNLPMEYEPERRCVTVLRPANDGNPALLFEDPRAEPGELLAPDRFPAAAIAVLKKAKGVYAWAGQYQQRPTPREGGLFKRSWFAGKLMKEAPAGTLWVRHWDLAASKRSGSARTAGVKLGRMPDGRYVVGHVVKTQEEGHEVRKLIRSTAEVDTYEVQISLPQDPGQAGKVQAQDMVAMLAGFVAHAEPETGDKHTRAEPFAVQCEAGNVYLIEGAWNEDYLDELCLFPNGTFKDQVDASSGAFGRLVILAGGFDLSTYLKAYG